MDIAWNSILIFETDPDADADPDPDTDPDTDPVPKCSVRTTAHDE